MTAKHPPGEPMTLGTFRRFCVWLGAVCISVCANQALSQE